MKLLRLDISISRRIDKVPGKLPARIFGELRAGHADTEAQQRGILHLHILLWCTYGSVFFARFVDSDEECAKLCAYFDALVTSSFSAEEHAIIKTREAEKRSDAPFFPECADTLFKIIESGKQVIAEKQIHKHTCRCRKICTGATKCAVARHQPCSSECYSHMVDVHKQIPSKTSDVQKNSGRMFHLRYKQEGEVYLVAATENIPPASLLLTQLHSLLPAVDLKRLCVTNKRTLPKDGFVVEINPIMAAELRSNTNTACLGGGEDVRSALYYLTKYIAKNPADLLECISLLKAARKASLRQKSVAEDADEDTIAGLQKIFNRAVCGCGAWKAIVLHYWKLQLLLYLECKHSFEKHK